MGLIQGILEVMFPPMPESLTDVVHGRVATVRGEVVARDLIECPLTNDKCVYYHYAIEQWRSSRVLGGPDEGFWQLRERDEAITEFYITDGNERAIIAPARAEISRAKGITARSYPLTRTQRGRQLLICPGDVVEVTALIDVADDLFDEGRAYRQDATRWLLRAPETKPIRITLVERARAAELRQVG